LISSNTIKRIEKRREKKGTLNMSRMEEYTAADRGVKKSVKDKKDYIKELASQSENAAGQGNLKDLYLTTQPTSQLKTRTATSPLTSAGE
jgi:hypothetical protein